MIDRAQEFRTSAVTVQELSERDIEFIRTILETRWGHCSVDELGLQQRSKDLLYAFRIRTLSDLLKTLSPIQPPLSFDLAVFKDNWEALVKLGLRTGDAFNTWAILLSNANPSISLDDVVCSIRDICSGREWAVVRERFTLFGEPFGDAIDISNDEVDASGQRSLYYRTYENVGVAIRITRERVRQFSCVLRRNYVRHHAPSLPHLPIPSARLSE